MKRAEILPLVTSDLSARIAKGAKQYGEPLTSHNGRDALQDAYEEALDLACYLRQAIAERGKQTILFPEGHVGVVVERLVKLWDFWHAPCREIHDMLDELSEVTKPAPHRKPKSRRKPREGKS